MSKPERVAEERAVKEAFKIGVRSIKLNIRGKRGYNDRLFWVEGGRPLLVEFKREGKSADPLQAHRHDELRAAGYETMVATEWQPVVAKIRSMREAEADRRKMLGLAAKEMET